MHFATSRERQELAKRAVNKAQCAMPLALMNQHQDHLKEDKTKSKTLEILDSLPKESKKILISQGMGLMKKLRLYNQRKMHERTILKTQIILLVTSLPAVLGQQHLQSQIHLTKREASTWIPHKCKSQEWRTIIVLTKTNQIYSLKRLLQVKGLRVNKNLKQVYDQAWAYLKTIQRHQQQVIRVIWQSIVELMSKIKHHLPWDSL